MAGEFYVLHSSTPLLSGTRVPKWCWDLAGGRRTLISGTISRSFTLGFFSSATVAERVIPPAMSVEDQFGTGTR